MSHGRRAVGCPGAARSISLSALGDQEGWEVPAGLCAKRPGRGGEGRGELVCGELPAGAPGAAAGEGALPQPESVLGGCGAGMDQAQGLSLTPA